MLLVFRFAKLHIYFGFSYLIAFLLVISTILRKGKTEEQVSSIKEIRKIHVFVQFNWFYVSSCCLVVHQRGITHHYLRYMRKNI